MIRFLFFESMLLGAYFRKNKEKFENKFHWSLPIITVLMFGLYFASKMIFVKYSKYASLQILNQLLIFGLLFFLFYLFASLDARLQRMPKVVKKVLIFLSDITLEIYVVQYVIIALIRPYLTFPLNWIAITASIILAAFILHVVCELFYKLVAFLGNKIGKNYNIK